MRKLLVLALFTNAVLLAGRFWQELPRAQAGNGGGGAATQNGDVNGDGKRDISDPVAMLNWLFASGPEPVAIAAEVVGLTQEQTKLLDDLAFGSKISGAWISGFGDLSTITAFGTYNDSDPEDFQNVHGGYNSPTRGIWKRNDDGSVTLTTVAGRFDAGGVLVDVIKFVARIEFNETFDESTGTYHWELFEPGDEVYRCNAEPFDRGGPFSIRAWKVCPEDPR